jgi:hypothetical protein
VIFLGSGVIGASGVEFGFETAEMKCFAVTGDLSDPLIRAFVEMNAGKTGRGIFSFSPVAGIFGMGTDTQIGLSVIEGIAKAMVNDKIRRGIHNLPVKINDFRFKVAGYESSSGVEIAAIAMDPPFEMSNLIIIIEV